MQNFVKHPLVGMTLIIGNILQLCPIVGRVYILYRSIAPNCTHNYYYRRYLVQRTHPDSLVTNLMLRLDRSKVFDQVYFTGQKTLRTNWQLISVVLFNL